MQLLKLPKCSFLQTVFKEQPRVHQVVIVSKGSSGCVGATWASRQGSTFLSCPTTWKKIPGSVTCMELSGTVLVLAINQRSENSSYILYLTSISISSILTTRVWNSPTLVCGLTPENVFRDEHHTPVAMRGDINLVELEERPGSFSEDFLHWAVSKKCSWEGDTPHILASHSRAWVRNPHTHSNESNLPRLTSVIDEQLDWELVGQIVGLNSTIWCIPGTSRNAPQVCLQVMLQGSTTDS